MPVGISSDYVRCNGCDKLGMHTIEHHYFPEEKTIRICRKCGNRETQFYRRQE